ncbi:MAG: Lrp/AsnC family transcriptional regulator [Synergistes jonesii]|uniref:Lrp/AsnC family transcriptional regulator n=1 Tax=Synergistes jonesii TaxID=2754 RepID=UPI002A757329|nr:Lrp/AsnC family transcriptional regulator [Synergistes jonesii]MDY2984787.1 Lrp/AsnC family transcriptional regulator [Synergistes jonesii]
MGRNRVINLDDTGWKILSELQQNPRIPYREIGRRVNLSCSSVLERIRRMEEEGIIQNYQVVLDALKIGYTIQAIIKIKFYSLNDEEILLEKLRSNAYVRQLWVTTGESDFIMETVFPAMEGMNDFLVMLGKHGRTFSSIVIDKPIFNAQLYPPARMDGL